MYVAVAAAGAFGFAGALFLLLHNALFGEKIKMSRRMDNVLGEKEIPIRKQELSAPLYQRMFRPMLGRAANLMLSVVPFAREAELERKVIRAGHPGNLSAREWMVVKGLLSVGLSAILWVILRGSGTAAWQMTVLILPVMLIGWFSVDGVLSAKGQRRKEQVQRDLPDILDLLTVSVEAGLGFEGALIKIVEKTEGLLSDEFLTVLRETKMGRPRKEALKDMANRLEVDSLSNFVGSIIMAEQLGVSIGKVLRIQSKEIRQKKRQHAEETAMKAPIKMLIPMMMFIFPAVFIVLLGPAILQIMRVF